MKHDSSENGFGNREWKLLGLWTRRFPEMTGGLEVTFGQKVRNARLTLKMTQAELAKSLGKHRDTVMHYEDGAHQPRTKQDRQRLAEVLQVPYNELFRDDESVEQREIGLDWDLLRAVLTDKKMPRLERLRQARLWKSILRYLIADPVHLAPDDQQKVSEMLRLISTLDGIPQDAPTLRGGGIG